MSANVYRKHLQQIHFNAIKIGDKKSEGRLRKGDISNIDINDNIVFYNDNGEEISCNVTNVKYYDTLQEMLSYELNKVLPYVDNIEQGLSIYRKIYSVEDEKRYKVIVIDIEVINK